MDQETYRWRITPWQDKVLPFLRNVPTCWDYLSKTLSDIIPIVFVLYAFYLGAEIRFDSEGRLLGYDENGQEKDPILDRLYRQTVSLLLDGKFREGESLLHELEQNVSDSIIKNESARKKYISFIKSFILARPGVLFSPIYPDPAIARDLSRVLLAHKSKNIYEHESGLSLISSSYDQWDSYSSYESSRVNMLFADLIRRLDEGRDVFYSSRSYLPMPRMMSRYDTIVGSFLGDYGDILGFIDGLLSLSTWKTAVLLVKYNFCAHPDAEDIRSKLCERGILEECIERDCLYNSTSHSVILVLNREKKVDAPVLFNRLQTDVEKITEELIYVTSESLQHCHYVFDSSLYHQEDSPAERIDEKDSLMISLGETIDHYVPLNSPLDAFETDVETPPIGISEGDFLSCSSKALRATIPHSGVDGWWFISGPAISVLLTGDKLKLCRVDERINYVVPENTLSFFVSERVDTSYLIYTLFSSERLRFVLECLSRINTIHGSGSYLFDILSAQQIRIIADKHSQTEYMNRLMLETREVAKTDTEYGVVLVGSPLSAIEKGELPNWLLNITAETDSIRGDSGLEGILKADREKTLPAINAVILDAKVGFDKNGDFQYKGLFDAQQLLSFYGIPAIVYSDIQWDSLGSFAYVFNDLKSGHNQFVNKEEKDSLKNAIRFLRDHLDSLDAPGTAIKKQYAQQLAAAQKIDSYFGNLQLADTFERILLNKISPKEWLGKLRIIRDECFLQVLIDHDVLPPCHDGFNMGAHSDFVADRFFRPDKGEFCYILTKSIIPKHIGTLLKATKELLNVGAHTQDDSDPDTRMAALHIIMGVFVSFAEFLDRHDLKSSNRGFRFWEKKWKNDFGRGDKKTVQVIKSQFKSDYYYAGNCHLDDRICRDKRVKEGDTVIINYVDFENTPRIEDEYQVWLYCKDFSKVD